jgi:hypothetical protein
MTTTQLLSPKEIIALLAQNGAEVADRAAFVKSFQALFPSLPAQERANLLIEILSYVDSVLEPETLQATA